MGIFLSGVPFFYQNLPPKLNKNADNTGETESAPSTGK